MENKNTIKKPTMQEIFGEVISKYSREQAIEDGVLIDVTEKAKEAGFKTPVCITQHLHSVINNIPERKKGIESYSGRLWDVLWMASLAVRGEFGKEDPKTYLPFSLYITYPGPTTKPKIQNLIIAFNKAEGFTIMFPEDD